MRIGLIDVDNMDKLGDCFPNLPLMKISAYHKSKGDLVEWYDAMTATIHNIETGENLYDVVYMSKVFSFTPDYEHYIFADRIERGGSGYCIHLEDGRENFDTSKDTKLPDEIEHIMPDYSLYGIKDTAYGFMSRGCPRGCDFCHVGQKEGRKSYKVADLSEFWNGQKNINLYDPNVLACKEWKDILTQLRDSRACVDFNQGLDVRLITDEKLELIKQIRIKMIHFAWDRYQDGDLIKPKLKRFAEATGWDRHKVTVYILCNFDTTIDQDLERIRFIRDECGFQTYVMLYDKDNIPKNHELRKLQRWCNNPWVFNSCEWEDYQKKN